MSGPTCRRTAFMGMLVMEERGGSGPIPFAASSRDSIRYEPRSMEPRHSKCFGLSPPEETFSILGPGRISGQAPAKPDQSFSRQIQPRCSDLLSSGANDLWLPMTYCVSGADLHKRARGDWGPLSCMAETPSGFGNIHHHSDQRLFPKGRNLVQLTRYKLLVEVELRSAT